jgi:hypothetical protein
MNFGERGNYVIDSISLKGFSGDARKGPLNIEYIELRQRCRQVDPFFIRGVAFVPVRVLSARA